MTADKPEGMPEATCAHKRVVPFTEEKNGMVYNEYWACEDCRMKFTPYSLASRSDLPAQNLEMQELDEPFTKILHDNLLYIIDKENPHIAKPDELEEIKQMVYETAFNGKIDEDADSDYIHVIDEVLSILASRGMILRGK